MHHFLPKLLDTTTYGNCAFNQSALHAHVTSERLENASDVVRATTVYIMIIQKLTWLPSLAQNGQKCTDFTVSFRTFCGTASNP